MQKVRVIDTIADILDFPFDEELIATKIRGEGTPNTFTYREFRKHVMYYAEKLGIDDVSGRNIALVGNSGYGWVIAFFAIIYCGGTAVLFDSKMQLETAAALLKNSECDTVFIDKDIHKKWELPQKLKVLEFSNSCNEFQNAECSEVFCMPNIKPDSPALIAFTSGTTGENKMVLLTH